MVLQTVTVLQHIDYNIIYDLQALYSKFPRPILSARIYFAIYQNSKISTIHLKQ